jgi:hypothetical protein
MLDRPDVQGLRFSGPTASTIDARGPGKGQIPGRRTGRALALASATVALLAVVPAGAVPTDPPVAAGDVPSVSNAARHDTSPPLVEPAPASRSAPAPGGASGGGFRSSAGFDGLSSDDNLAVLGRRVLPPDPTGEAGPDHYVQAVNQVFAVFDKDSGALAPGFPMALDALWAGFGTACETAGRGDPVVVYDQLADRWNISQFALTSFPEGPFFQCVAVSATGDPTGRYHRYAFLYDEEEANDYPKLAVWPDAYVLTVNEASGPGFNFSGVGVVALDRAAMLEGRPATQIKFELPPNSFGLLPADLDGATLPPAGAPKYLVSVAADEFGEAGDAVEVWELRADFTAPSASDLTGPTTLPVTPFDPTVCDFVADCIPQPGTPVGLDALSRTVMMRAAYRNFGTHEAIVFNHTVDADGTDHAGVRYYEVRDPARPVLVQEATHAPDADHRWMGSVAMDGAGNLALGYTVSGPTTFPSPRYAGRLASDPSGTLPRGEATLVQGSGAQTSFRSRWGDYSHMSVDPVDDCTFWFTSEYYASTSEAGWRTRIGSFAFPGCTTAPVCPPEEATIVGTGAGEVLVGTPADDIVIAGGGDDMVLGGGGNDLICGDGGDDVLVGDAGADVLVGGDGDDTLRGGAGDDESAGGEGHDVLTDGDGDDSLSGEGGDDIVRGGGGADEVSGAGGSDRLLGEEGDDHLDGGAGDDRLNGGAGTDVCDGGPGRNGSFRCEGASIP